MAAWKDGLAATLPWEDGRLTLTADPLPGRRWRAWRPSPLSLGKLLAKFACLRLYGLYLERSLKGEAGADILYC